MSFPYLGMSSFRQLRYYFFSRQTEFDKHHTYVYTEQLPNGLSHLYKKNRLSSSSCRSLTTMNSRAQYIFCQNKTHDITQPIRLFSEIPKMGKTKRNNLPFPGIIVEQKTDLLPHASRGNCRCLNGDAGNASHWSIIIVILLEEIRTFWINCAVTRRSRVRS